VQPSSPLVSPGHDNNIGLLRCLLALSVIFSHSYALLLGMGGYEPLASATSGQFDFGGTAVNAFFTLSGLVVTQAWLRHPNPRYFLTQRVRRIYPGLIVACLVCLAAVTIPAPHQRIFDAQWYGYIALAVLLTAEIPTLPRLFPDNPVPFALNGSTWTIGYEVACYFVLLFLGLAGALGWRRVTLGLFVLAWLTLVATTTGALTSPWPRFGTHFLAGVVAYLYRDRIPAAPLLMVGAVLALLVSAALPPVGLLVFPVAGTYLLLYAAYRTPPSQIGRAADYSYGLYLYGFPVQQFLIYYLAPALTPITLFLAASLISAGLAWLSWHGVERRFLRRPSLAHEQVETAAQYPQRKRQPADLARWSRRR
jgi:peptidoglycan/LPS O-acetylase OafA/YrhL